jgi:hypothetical protein
MTNNTEQRRAFELLPCPFCGHKPFMSNLIDSMHPTGGYRHEHEEGFAYYSRDPVGAKAELWCMGCLESEGGCGAEVSGEGKEGVIAAWNRRPAPSLCTAEEAAELAESMSLWDAVRQMTEQMTEKELANIINAYMAKR